MLLAVEMTVVDCMREKRNSLSIEAIGFSGTPLCLMQCAKYHTKRYPFVGKDRRVYLLVERWTLFVQFGRKNKMTRKLSLKPGVSVPYAKAHPFPPVHWYLIAQSWWK
jgi:hypothetical protein